MSGLIFLSHLIDQSGLNSCRHEAIEDKDVDLYDVYV